MKKSNANIPLQYRMPHEDLEDEEPEEKSYLTIEQQDDEFIGAPRSPQGFTTDESFRSHRKGR